MDIELLQIELFILIIVCLFVVLCCDIYTDYPKIQPPEEPEPKEEKPEELVSLV